MVCGAMVPTPTSNSSTFLCKSGCTNSLLREAHSLANNHVHRNLVRQDQWGVCPV